MPARMCRRLRYDCGERLRPAVHFRHIRRMRHESFAPQSLPAVGPERCGRATAGRCAPGSLRRRPACLPRRVSMGLYRIWRQSCVPQSLAAADPMRIGNATAYRSVAGIAATPARRLAVTCFSSLLLGLRSAFSYINPTYSLIFMVYQHFVYSLTSGDCPASRNGSPQPN